MPADPTYLDYVKRAAQATGADPVALAAAGLVESGGKAGARGDGNTSFGYYQLHIGGALPKQYEANPFPYADSYDAVLNRAREFKRLQVHGGPGAAAVQRPADAAGYAARVNARLAEARRLLGQQQQARLGPRAPASPGSLAPPRPATSTPFPASVTGLDRRGFAQGILDAQAKTVGLGQAIQLPETAFAAPSDVDVPLSPTAPPSPKVQAAGPQAQRVISIAKQYLGTPYKWGGADPKTGFDCSGLAQYLYRQVGVDIPRTTYEQIKVGQPVGLGQIKAGDLLFFGSRQDPHHMGIAIGNGQFIHAPHTGDVVKISNLAEPYYQQHFVTGRRVD